MIITEVLLHISFCYKKTYVTALCYQLNSWMDAPIRRLGPRHRVARHNLHLTILVAWVEFLTEDEWKAFIKEAKKSALQKVLSHYSTKDWATSKVSLITDMILQHLELDGLLTPRQLEEMKREGLIIDVPPRARPPQPFPERALSIGRHMIPYGGTWRIRREEINLPLACFLIYEK